MANNSDNPILSDDHLLAMLDHPEAPELEASWQALEKDGAAQAQMADYLLVESALTGDAFADAYAAAETENDGPLPAGLEAKLKAISQSHTAPNANRPPWLKVLDGGSENLATPRAPRTWYRGALMAAMVLIAVGLGQYYTSPTPGPEIASGPDMRWKGKHSTAMPVNLLHQLDGQGATYPEAELKEAGHWYTKMSMTGVLQLEYKRPQSIPIGDAFEASATIFAEKSSGERVPLAKNPIEIRGDKTSQKQRIGKPIRLEALSGNGFAPGDRLIFDIQAGPDSSQIIIELTTP